MKPHEFDPEAELELLAAADFLEAREHGLGTRFLLAVHRAIERLKYDPASRPKVLSDVRRQPVEDFRFDVLYLDEPDQIWIVAVVHYSRRTGYWRKRLR